MYPHGASWGAWDTTPRPSDVITASDRSCPTSNEPNDISVGHHAPDLVEEAQLGVPLGLVGTVGANSLMKAASGLARAVRI